MRKEELEKEAEEWVISNTEIYDDKFGLECEEVPNPKEAYIAGAEPREKQIQIDAEQIRALQKQNGELTDEVKELEKENEILKKANEIIAQQRDNRDADIAELEKENERLKGDLELWENGACRATNLDKCGVVKELEAQIEKMKSDVIECFGSEYNVLVAKLLNKWEIKEK